MKKWIYLTVSILLFAGIYWFSAQDAATSSTQSNEVIVKLHLMTEDEMVQEPEKASDYRFVVRKSAHFILYMVLSIFVFLTLVEFTEAHGFAFLAGWLIVIVLAAIDEYHQSFVPGRSMELTDVGIDACGALLGVLIVFSFYKSVDKRRNRKKIYYYGRQ